MAQANIDDYKDTQRNRASKRRWRKRSEEKSVQFVCTIIRAMHAFKWIYMQSVVIESKYNTFVGGEKER